MSFEDLLPAVEAQLNRFDAAERQEALAELVAHQAELALPPEREIVNLHSHTFFSFNALGYSPAGLAWLARKRGYRAMGIVDFDVLDGVDEFLDACERLGVRGSAGMETRIFLPEFIDQETNSPGEPGVTYYMGTGFYASQVPEDVQPILQGLKDRADSRNRVMLERINAYLDPVQVDYERDVLPLTPGGNPTERHLVLAYLAAVERSGQPPAKFWSEKLDLPQEQVTEAMMDAGEFQNQVRSRLMKRGGAGYMAPTPESFPRLDEVNRLIVASGAIPCVAFLDGLSRGEQDMESLLGFYIERGAAVLNIIPDRNWNVADPLLRAEKVRRLHDVVGLAEGLGLPIQVGTEMNSSGQKLVDDFRVPEMLPVRQAFLNGAAFIFGHTLLSRAAGNGFQSDWAFSYFPDRKDRTDFYTRLGYVIPPGQRSLDALRLLGNEATPWQYLDVPFSL